MAFLEKLNFKTPKKYWQEAMAILWRHRLAFLVSIFLDYSYKILFSILIQKGSVSKEKSQGLPSSQLSFWVHKCHSCLVRKKALCNSLTLLLRPTCPYIDPEWKQDWKSVKATKSSNNSDLAACKWHMNNQWLLKY